MVDPSWGLLLIEGDRRKMFLSPVELSTLTFTTPLLDYTSMGLSFWSGGRSETVQRAIGLTLLLRLHQAGHDGKLPASLGELLAPPGGQSDLAATPEDLVDPYSGEFFGYVGSHGQRLLPIDAIEGLFPTNAVRPPERLKSTEGCMLLYSVGPDGVDDRAERNLESNRRGDLVFPLKDNVKPPATEPRH